MATRNICISPGSSILTRLSTLKTCSTTAQRLAFPHAKLSWSSTERIDPSSRNACRTPSLSYLLTGTWITRLWEIAILWTLLRMRAYRWFSGFLTTPALAGPNLDTQLQTTRDLCFCHLIRKRIFENTYFLLADQHGRQVQVQTRNRAW